MSRSNKWLRARLSPNPTLPGLANEGQHQGIVGLTMTIRPQGPQACNREATCSQQILQKLVGGSPPPTPHPQSAHKECPQWAPSGHGVYQTAPNSSHTFNSWQVDTGMLVNPNAVPDDP